MGQNQALLELAGRTLLDLIVERLREVADEVIIVAGETDRYARIADRCVVDVFPGVGTLGGLHAGCQADRRLTFSIPPICSVIRLYATRRRTISGRMP
jgi:molybdopterin-guanine dinucleotide biosynthesis protein A